MGSRSRRRVGIERRIGRRWSGLPVGRKPSFWVHVGLEEAMQETAGVIAPIILGLVGLDGAIDFSNLPFPWDSASGVGLIAGIKPRIPGLRLVCEPGIPGDDNLI